jgi:tryptophan halogenase
MENPKAIDRILIVGGGTAGWLTAGYLDSILNPPGVPRTVDIALVESEDIGIVGVGEATVPTLAETLSRLHISERDFLRACEGGFKLAIEFRGWKTGKEDDVYLHPFCYPGSISGISPAAAWHQRRLAGDPTPYAHAIGPHAVLCGQCLAPRDERMPDFQSPFRYAYHIDAAKFGRFLRDTFVSRGVRHVVDNVTGTRLREDGMLDVVVTEKHGELPADLFIDCSGFRGLLINQVYNVSLHSFGDTLINDRAVAMQVPHPPGTTTIRSYTRAVARGSGWIWDIGLYQRRGIGHVYASAFQSDEQAVDDLREYIGPDSKDMETRLLKIRVGYNERCWEKNVVAIGLSSGFLEPLESTGIYLIEFGIKYLLEHFPDRDFDPALARAYNEHVHQAYREIHDFVLLHYILTQREDTPYWRFFRHEAKVPDPLKERLDLWSHRWPSNMDLPYRHLFFNHDSWTFILAGMDRLPRTPTLMTSIYRRHSALIDKWFADQRTLGQKGLGHLPSHYSYLRSLHGETG